jgi:hypothetical protein
VHKVVNPFRLVVLKNRMSDEYTGIRSEAPKAA